MTKEDKVFVWSISAFGLLYVVLVGDFKVGKSLVSALYACLWAICIFAVYFSIKTCVHLRKEDLKRWADYVPTIPEYRPPRPSNAVGLLITTPIVAIAITAMIFSVIYVRTHRSLEKTGVHPDAGFLQLERKEVLGPEAILVPGRTFRMNYHFFNRGSLPVSDTHNWSGLICADSKLNPGKRMMSVWQASMTDAIRKYMPSKPTPGGSKIGVNQEIWNTAVSDPLTRTQIRDLKIGALSENLKAPAF